MIPKKPEPKNMDEFISGAKDSQSQHTTEAPATAGKDKTLLIRIPHDVWYTAKQQALSEGLTLHDYVIAAIVAKNR